MTSHAQRERISIRLPNGFDRDKHFDLLERQVAEQQGEGFSVISIDTETMTATAERVVEAMMEADSDAEVAESIEVPLPPGLHPYASDRYAERFAKEHPGYTMTEFEPRLGYATLAKLA